MNARERFLALMSFEPVDRGLLWEFGYWGGTIERWHNEGLPKQAGHPRALAAGETVCGPGLHWPVGDLLRDSDVSNCLGLDAGLVTIPIEAGLFPPFEEVVLAEDEDTVTMINTSGVTLRKRKDDSSIPQFFDWPIKGRQDFERLKAERFVTGAEGRFPGNWPELVAGYKRRDYPLAVLPCGCFGALRSLMGEMRLLTAYYDDPRPERIFRNEDCVVSILRFRGGCTAKVLTTVGCRRPIHHNLMVYGTKATFLNESSRGRLSTGTEESDFVEVDTPYLEIPKGVGIAHFIDCAETGQLPLVNVH